MFKKVKNKKGFTLIELIVVIAILAVLAAIIIPTVSSSLVRANNARDLGNARSIYAELSISALTEATFADVEDATRTGPDGLACTYSVVDRSITEFSCVGSNATFTLQATGEISE